MGDAFQRALIAVQKVNIRDTSSLFAAKNKQEESKNGLMTRESILSRSDDAYCLVRLRLELESAKQ